MRIAVAMALCVAAAAATASADPPAAPPPAPDASLAYYPKAALAAGLDGEATLSCARDAHLALRDCTLVSETPTGQGFGAAALAMAVRSPDNPALDVDEAALTGVKPITVSFHARPASIDPDLTQMAHVLKSPQLEHQPPADILWKYYPDRAHRSGIQGRASIRCLVTRAGRLTGCVVRSESPADHDFGAAARLVAEREYRTTPLLYDGQPSDGGEADLTINFDPR